MKLYDYQQKIFDEVINKYKTKNRIMIVIPTGGGKTVIFSHIVKKLGLKTLIIAHTKELIDQAKNTLHRVGATADVMSIQKVFIMIKKRSLSHYELVIVDECHRSGANSYTSLIAIQKDAKLLGVTATPFRHDNKKLSSIFEERVSPLNLIDMIDKKLLCDFEGYRVKTDTSLKGVSTKAGDFVASKLAAVINVAKRNKIIVDKYLNICPKSKTICFAINIKHAEELNREFQSRDILSAVIHGEISKTKREDILRRFKDGRILVLVSCQILTEGFDEPSITCILMARPTCSKVLYTQMIGRGSRIYPGKDVCKVIEFTDNEYDVCSMEDLVNSEVKCHRLNQGEKLSDFSKRAKELIDQSGQTFVEKMVIIPTNIYQKEATNWQRQFLKMQNISFQEPLTEFVANQLIIQGKYGAY